MWQIKLERENEISLSRQLFYAMKDLILEGKIQSGEALPSSRGLAKDMSVSRSTVNEAYDMLETEGFIVTRQGAPTRVKEGLYLEKHQKHYEEVLFPVIQGSEQSFIVDFKTGQPDVSLFPRYVWNQMMYKAFEQLSDNDLGYFGTAGYEALRVEISHWLFRKRGLSAKPQDIFITSGTTQALSILVTMLSKEGVPFAVEDPCHKGLLEVIESSGNSILSIPVDQEGLKTSLLNGHDISAVYVTPSHQFPLGSILTAERRIELIKLARQRHFYIIEDDYDSEFRYRGAAVSPLYALDSEQVLYTGSFSKSLYPALRIGFVILPPKLQANWMYLRKHFDVQNPIVEQAALTAFLRQRKLDKYIQKISRLYEKKRLALTQAIYKYFGEQCTILGDETGLHLVLQVHGAKFDEVFVKKSQDAGIRVFPIEHYCIVKGDHLDQLMLGYGHLKIEDIPKSVSKLYNMIMT
ncbi:MocR-like pyridoxine biosynthesis transcription factor PdxR [Fusibacter ferrireducens]|uniref:PLP-dependent aminotransferase family protein n=1 Tax=Fusibacter ferrireducens TaxID=2785058 RepID=A0ABR9ZR91_9FIRM|nr:PLP-dependent aminotransferase family protein [Fusibacter ferrireducens]MBF4692460.1 PLP-dependent aminotransferase family protein [Fusibacter ferrireducens]